MNLTRMSATALTTLALAAGPALAQDDGDGAAPAAADGALNKANSVNLSPLGLLVGSYALNYERLMNRRHGLLVEGVFTSATGDGTSSTGYGGVVGYRWHWSPSQDSGFAGLNVGYQVGTGTAQVEDGDGDKASFDVDTTALTVTANIGRRWAWDFGLNITLRAGLGYGKYDVSTDSDDELAQDAVELVDELLTLIPVAIDGELSIGWIF